MKKRKMFSDDQIKQIGKRLRIARLEANIHSLIKAAELIGINADLLGHYEAGRRMPDLYRLKQMAKVYGVDWVTWATMGMPKKVHPAVTRETK